MLPGSCVSNQNQPTLLIPYAGRGWNRVVSICGISATFPEHLTGSSEVEAAFGHHILYDRQNMVSAINVGLQGRESVVK
jgi:hypothetical protein